MADDLMTLAMYRDWVRRGSPDADPSQCEMFRVAALASGVRGYPALDDQSFAIAHIAIVRRSWLRGDPKPPPSWGCDVAITADGRGVVLVVPCTDGDVFVHLARRGRHLVSMMFSYVEAFNLQSAQAVSTGLARTWLFACETFGWPSKDQVARTREQVNELLREIHAQKYPRDRRS